MSLIDARAEGLPATLETDVCIVGAGAAGITVAVTLLRSGRDVCLIESGGFAPDPETQALYDLQSVGYPQRPDYMSRARYFGGSCNLWAGRSMPLSLGDFLPREWVAYSGWPISYDEVARYYASAGRILGLPALNDVEYRVLPAGMSVHERRLFEGGVLAPTISLWARKPRRFGATYRGQLRRARGVRVLLNLSATRLALDGAGDRVASLEARTLDGARHTIRARRFVLACGGIENARLLLVSPDRDGVGIGNRHGLVGRFFMDHPRAVLGRFHVPAGQELPLLRGRPLRDGKIQLGIGLSAEAQRRERLLNHYVTFEALSSGYAESSYQSMVQVMKVLLRRGHAGSRWDFARARIAALPEMIYLLSPKELMPHPVYRAYVALRERMPRRKRPRSFVVVYFCEQPPLPTSRVELTGDCDRLGLPKLKLHWQLDDEFVGSVFRMQDLLQREFARSGVGRLEPSTEVPAFTDASHHMGTTRMGSNPEAGVVDPDCRVHGIRNLYVAGSSVFPCAGHANPTLTIVALAERLADHLAAKPDSA